MEKQIVTYKDIKKKVKRDRYEHYWKKDVLVEEGFNKKNITSFGDHQNELI